MSQVQELARERCFFELPKTVSGLARELKMFWPLQMGQLLFTDSKSWNDDYMGPAMMAPPLFCMLLLLSGFALLVMYCCMDQWHRRRLSYKAIPQTLKGERDREDVASHDSRQFEVFSIDDSANETSDGEHAALSAQPLQT